MYRLLFIFVAPLLFISCKNETIDFDETDCSTLITLTIDEALLNQPEGYIHLKTTLTGGLGQDIHSVGYCWSKDFNVAPVKDSNSIYIPYESIVLGSEDVNGDGKINQQDFYSDGGMILRTFSSDIPINLSGVTLIQVKAFVSFNDSLAIYSYSSWLDVKK
jgi:hypothetical protein